MRSRRSPTAHSLPRKTAPRTSARFTGISMSTDYVHGYTEREAQRLGDQARSVVDLLHGDTEYPAGSRVLEAGCGTGEQTVTLARRSPGARFLSVDHSADSLRVAREAVRKAGLSNVQFEQGDIYALPYAPD